jgi:hypothetical protein
LALDLGAPGIDVLDMAHHVAPGEKSA